MGRELARRAIRGPESGATWLGLGYDPVLNRFAPRPLGVDLYGGLGGVACFLCALAVVANDDEARDLALGALVSLKELADDPQRVRAFARTAGLGVGTGLGSLVYSLLVAGRLLGAADLVSTATRLAPALTLEAAGPRPSLDLLSGLAGGLVALTELFRRTREARWLIQGEPLAEVLRRSDQSRDVGVAHGGDGVAIAIARFESAMTAAPLPRSRWEPARGDGASSWCRGEVGRLLATSVSSNADWRAEASTACDAPTLFRSLGGDSRCCGRSGPIELLLRASERSAGPTREALRARARHEALGMAADAEVRGGYQLLGRDPAPMLVPGFFRGLCGVGYQLLRVCAPARLPSILSFCIE